MTLFKVSVMTSIDGWNCKVKKYNAKETDKNYLLNDFMIKRLSKDKIGKIDSYIADSTYVCSRHMYILEEDRISDTIELLVDDIKRVVEKMKKDIDKIIFLAPDGKVDKNKIVIEDADERIKITLTEDML